MTNRSCKALGLFCVASSVVLFLFAQPGGSSSDRTSEEIGCALYRVTLDPEGHMWHGTGFAVANTEAGAIIMTATHVVRDWDIMGEPLPSVIGAPVTLDIPNLPDVPVQFGSLLTYLDGSDVALILIPDFVAPVTLDVGEEMPEFGDRVTLWGTVPYGPIGQEGFVGKALITNGVPTPDHAYFMFNIPAFPGCSGGPVLNNADEVVGIIVWGYMPYPVSLAVPLDCIRSVLERADL